MRFWRSLRKGFRRANQAANGISVLAGLRCRFTAEASSRGLISKVIASDCRLRLLDVGRGIKPFNKSLIGIHVKCCAAKGALSMKCVLYGEPVWVNQTICARLVLHHLTTLQSVELLALWKINARRVFAIVTKEAV
tara:strand:- start:9 stop:416 length:408 start_codon:yes stop_codon:yes gene_type:complete